MSKLCQNILLFLLLVFSISCEIEKKDVDPHIKEEIDNTKEIIEASGNGFQKYIVAPEKVRLPEYENREMYRDQGGEGYILGFDIECKIPSKIDLSKFKTYELQFEVKQKDDIYKTLSNNEYGDIVFVKNPDLNKDGKTQNDEKFTQVRGISKLKSTEITNKKEVTGVEGGRELIDGTNTPTGKWVTIQSVIYNLEINKKLKCSISGIENNGIKSFLTNVTIESFLQN